MRSTRRTGASQSAGNDPALDPRLVVQILIGSEEPIGGWVSRGYHQKYVSTTMVGRSVCQGETSFVSKVEIGAASMTSYSPGVDNG